MKSKVLLYFLMIGSFSLYAQKLTRISPHVFNSEYEQFIIVHTFTENDEKIIAQIKNELSDRIIQLQQTIRSLRDLEITINIAPNPSIYAEWILGKHIVFENSIGYAELETNQIYIKNLSSLPGKPELITLLMHEYIHLYIYDHFPDAPLWFHEGMAHYFSSPINLEQIYYWWTNAFKKGYLLDQFPYTYPENEEELTPYYFQSFLIFRHLMQTKDNKLQDLFYLSEKNNNFHDCFTNIFYRTPESYVLDFYHHTLVRELRVQKAIKYAYLVALVIILTAVLLFYFRIKKQMRLEKLHQLCEEFGTLWIEYRNIRLSFENLLQNEEDKKLFYLLERKKNVISQLIRKKYLHLETLKVKEDHFPSEEYWLYFKEARKNMHLT